MNHLMKRRLKRKAKHGVLAPGQKRGLFLDVEPELIEEEPEAIEVMELTEVVELIDDGWTPEYTTAEEPIDKGDGIEEVEEAKVEEKPKKKKTTRKKKK